MLVCHCNVVTDNEILAAIEAGARDEVDIAASCGAGGSCGGCLPTVRDLLDRCAGCPMRDDARPASASVWSTV